MDDRQIFFCVVEANGFAEAAIQGLGITLLPDFIVEQPLSDGRLVRVLENYDREPLTLFALYPSRHYLPAKTRAFIDFLVTCFQNDN